jgi:hypothetical protein
VNEADAKPTLRKWWKYLLVLCLLGLVAFGAAAWYMTTDSFQAYVRARIVDEIQKATGGRVELGTYHTIPFRLQAKPRPPSGTRPPTIRRPRRSRGRPRRTIPLKRSSASSRS